MTNEVQYYDHYDMELKKSQYSKAKKFLDLGLIKYNGDGSFLCEPIPGYNTRTYQMKKHHLTGRFTCNCQHYVMQRKKVDKQQIGEDEITKCSHIAALIMAFKDKVFSHA